MPTVCTRPSMHGICHCLFVLLLNFDFGTNKSTVLVIHCLVWACWVCERDISRTFHSTVELCWWIGAQNVHHVHASRCVCASKQAQIKSLTNAFTNKIHQLYMLSRVSYCFIHFSCFRWNFFLLPFAPSFPSQSWHGATTVIYLRIYRSTFRIVTTTSCH